MIVKQLSKGDFKLSCPQLGFLSTRFDETFKQTWFEQDLGLNQIYNSRMTYEIAVKYLLSFYPTYGSSYE